ncbi:rod shape-determining protein MreD [Clostridium massiliamazoniense]|uniref:rod shape-determining protein MreD n=1 Tax=Clostridium massiliamazoniense TaxID=1347366 RepID=UPI0006D802D8|nr:rod shape-determining protein MreD [Clostridium massiliamazoniense]
MKRLIQIILCIVLFIIDTSIMPIFGIKGVYPSLLFVFVILYSTINGYKDAVILGSISGILQDIYFSHVFGINALVNLLLCVIAAYIGDKTLKNKASIPVLTVGGLTIVKFIAIFLICKMLKINVELENILIMVPYNFVVGILMYSSVYGMARKKLMKNQWNFSKK